MRVGIVGAGICGLAAARRLREAGVDAVVFDKARGPGGRMASRRSAAGALDLGAQYFTVTDSAFAEVVAALEAECAVARWTEQPAVRPADPGRGHNPPERYVGMPRMSAVTRALAEGLSLATGRRVSRVAPEDGGNAVTLVFDDGRVEGFDRVLVTTPPQQALALMPGLETAVADDLARVRLAPCWAVALGFEALPGDLPGAVFVNDGGPVAWVVRHDSRPGRDADAAVIVAHAGSDWSATHLEADPSAVIDAAHRHLASLWPGLAAAPAFSLAHRWRYARATNPLGVGSLAAAAGRLRFAGDWAADGRVEGAWWSGRHAAEQLLADAPQ